MRWSWRKNLIKLGMIMGKKLTQVSFLFVFATLLVVIGHADITLDYRDLWIYKWVYSFHMPLFFFLSGFLFAYTYPANKNARNEILFHS